MDQYIGTIMLFASDFAPEYWAICNGQVMNIQQNAALYSILGTRYGGDGVTTFALPDLRGVVPVGYGASSTQSSSRIVATLGQKGGAPIVTLNTNSLPPHNHTFSAQPQGTSLSTAAINNVSFTIPAAATTPNASTPSGTAYLANADLEGSAVNIYATGATPNVNMPGGKINIPSTAVTGTVGTVSGTTAVTGSGQAVSIAPPYLALNYIICINGIYPSRNY